MKTYKLLVLTNHKMQSSSNSIYALLTALARHEACERIDVASLGVSANKLFFKYHLESRLMAAPISRGFRFSEDGRAFLSQARWVEVNEYDFIFLRLPPPADALFFEFLTSVFPANRIINRPEGIMETGSKKYLLQHPELCPPMRYCEHIDQVEHFSQLFPIVLKPLNGYGGHGIIRIDGEKVWLGPQEISFSQFARQFRGNNQPFLAMKYLKHVSRGDKRVVVCRDTIVGASLRKPAKGNWLCNGAQGGASGRTIITKEERQIAAQLGKDLMKKGIFMFGFDTLTDDEGKRVLSEINTQSIGGLKQISEQRGSQILEKVTNLFWWHVKSIVDEEIFVSRAGS
jgi:glutathione synthase